MTKPDAQIPNRTALLNIKFTKNKPIFSRNVFMPFYTIINTVLLKKILPATFIFFIPFLSSSVTLAQSPTFLIPPAEFKAFDTPNDAGETISLTWSASPNDSPDVFYVIYIDRDKNGAFEKEAIRIKSNTGYRTSAPEIYGYRKSNSNYHYAQIFPRKVFNGEAIDKKQVYYFKLAMISGDSKIVLDTIASAKPHGNWLHTKKINNFVIMIIISTIILYFIVHARRNPDMFLRKIGGLDAVDEALGRATEMGKPVLFVHGLTGMGSISTIAATSILGRIARKIADYDANLKVVNNNPIVMSVSQEVVKES